MADRRSSESPSAASAVAVAVDDPAGTVGLLAVAVLATACVAAVVVADVAAWAAAGARAQAAADGAALAAAHAVRGHPTSAGGWDRGRLAGSAATAAAIVADAHHATLVDCTCQARASGQPVEVVVRMPVNSFLLRLLGWEAVQATSSATVADHALWSPSPTTESMT